MCTIFDIYLTCTRARFSMNLMVHEAKQEVPVKLPQISSPHPVQPSRYSRHTNMTSAMIGRKSPSSCLIGQLGIATYLSFVYHPYVVFPLGRFVIIWVFLRFKWILTGCFTMPVKVLTYDSSKHQHDRLEEGEGVKNAWKWSWLGWQVWHQTGP